jgi:hypothetical protein
MTERDIPRSLEGLRPYLEAEAIYWKDVVEGTEVEVEALDYISGKQGSFGFTVFDILTDKKGLHDVHMVLSDNDFTFVKASDRDPIQLPAGTILTNGMSCTHFPKTVGPMVFLDSLNVGRDVSFDDTMTPDSKVVGTVLVPRVSKIYSFLPDGQYNRPTNYDEYIDRVKEAKVAHDTDFELAVTELDQEIAEIVPKLFSYPLERTEVMEIFSDFIPQGRVRLLDLLEASDQQGKLGKFLPVLKKAITNEFYMCPPGHRGMPIIPSTVRGFNQMINELGLQPTSQPNQA